MSRHTAAILARISPKLLLLAAVVFALRGGNSGAEDLQVLYSDGQSEAVPIVSYEGVEHISYKSLDHILHMIDAGATLVHDYDPKNLRLVVAGKTVSVKEAFVIIEGRISRPSHPLQVVDGEFLIPVDTLQEINRSLGLFDQLQLPKAAEQPPVLPPEAAVPRDNLPELQPTPLSEEPLAPSDVEIAPAPGASEALPLTIPDHVREIASADLATLLRRAPLPSISAVALAPEGAEPSVQGSYAPVVQSVAAQVASRMQAVLEGTGRFAVRVPRQPLTLKSMARTVEWANNSQCHALAALTVDVSPNHNLSGMRIWTAHEAGDASARPTERGGAFGLPALFNYIPYEDYSLVLASLIFEEVNKTPKLKAHPVELAPSYLLRRVAMPAVIVSLGYASTDSERERMATTEFVEGAAQALCNALIRLQNLNQEQAYGA